jgi:G3E family GTPase
VNTVKKYQAIPTNIITGFLGVGKTTVILHLLKHKPANEHWAVLVNEFGEVGIDGALLAAEGIAVKEVPGGCMCCATGLPSKVALNQLIKSQNPDRILIEPTGLAHPKQILQAFGGKEYAGVLDLRAVICLLDPWSLSEQKFLGLPAFRDQIQLADVLVATKADTAQAEHLQLFDEFITDLKPAKTHVGKISQGNMPWQWLDADKVDQTVIMAVPKSHGGGESNAVAAERDSEGVLRQENQTEYGFGCGWLFPDEFVFSFEKLERFLKDLDLPRVKGVIKTDQGWHSVNRMREHIQIKAAEPLGESRLEIISLQPVDWLVLESKVKRCLYSA